MTVNKVILIGGLGKDPETRYAPSGAAITNLSLATSEKRKDQQGQYVEHTEWHKIVMFNKLADIAGQYLKKGSKVYIEGKLTTRKWQDKNTGQDRYSTEIIANEMKMLNSNQNQDGQQRPAQQKQQQLKAQPEPYFEGIDDDIPF